MSAPATVVSPFCQDEDIARRVWADYFPIVPKSQKLAYGADGVISSGGVLTSSSNVFDGAGVASGNVVRVSAPMASFPGADPQGELFAVDSVSGNTCTLRRLGLALGQGLPVPTASGVTFGVYTFAPQIDSASYDARKNWNIDEKFPNRSVTLLYDPRELVDWTVLTVVTRAFAACSKQVTADFERKFALFNQELAGLQGRLVIRWGVLQRQDAESSVFAARTRR